MATSVAESGTINPNKVLHRSMQTSTDFGEQDAELLSDSRDSEFSFSTRFELIFISSPKSNILNDISFTMLN